MRILSLSLLALAFAVGTMASADACSYMKTAQTQTTIADASQSTAPTTKIKVPRSGS